tara:strand:- start:320 stop:532 length:213 start_codon:yes stop_codon:yes gene_type:complete
MSKHIYHFCGEYQLDNGKIGKSDGIIEFPNKILDFKEYNKIKEYIFLNLENKISNYEEIAIISLCYLGSK